MRICLDAQMKPPAAYCSYCMGEIYDGDECYIVHGYIVCSDCADDDEKEFCVGMSGSELIDYQKKYTEDETNYHNKKCKN